MDVVAAEEMQRDYLLERGRNLLLIHQFYQYKYR